MPTATIDDRYRITIPVEARQGLKPGDVLFVVQEQSETGPVLHAAKAINPFDEVDLEVIVRAAGLDPDGLPARLSVAQRERLVSELVLQAGDVADAR